MKEASDNKPVPTPTPTPVVGFTTAQAYFDTVMAEEAHQEHATPSVSAFLMLQEEE